MALDTKLERASYIILRASQMEKARESYSKRWKIAEKRFKMIVEKRRGEDAWRESLPDTWAYATIKTAQAAFVDSRVIPTVLRHPDDPRRKSDDLRDLYVDIADKGNLELELYYTRLDTFKLGNGYTKTIYVKNTRTVHDIEKFDPDTNTFTYKKKVITEFDDPKTIRVSPYLMLVDELARGNPESIRDRIEVEVLGKDQAKELYGHLVDWDKIPKTVSLLEQLTEFSATTIAETDGTGLRGTDFEGLSKYHFFAPGFAENFGGDDYVEILHYINTGITTPSGAQDSDELLINGYPVKVDTAGSPSPIPYIHKQQYYTDYKFSPYSADEHYAAGIFEIGEAEITALQKHREMMADRQKLSLFSPAFSDVNDEIDQKDLALKPLSIIRTKGGTPKQFQIPGITNADLSLQDRYEAAFKRAVGIDERILGVESTGPRLTATEISFIREAALKRLREFAFLYKNSLLHSEIRLKFSLFRQYFSNPLSRDKKEKDNKGKRILAAKFKEFKVKSGNIYTKKEIEPSFFEGEIDVDLDLQLLLPLTAAQMATVWSQVIRDTIPAIQAGIVNYSLKKMYNNYIEALVQINPNSLVEDEEELSIEMAEQEHVLYSEKNTSKEMSKVLPEGTPEEFVSQAHLQKHKELLDRDTEIELPERSRLLEHIAKDIATLKRKQATRRQPNLTAFTPEATQGIGGIGGANNQPPPQFTPPETPTL